MDNLEDRITECKTKFDELEAQKLDIIAEQQRLQGEYRLLIDLQTNEKKPNKKATTIEAVPEKEG